MTKQDEATIRTKLAREYADEFAGRVDFTEVEYVEKNLATILADGAAGSESR